MTEHTENLEKLSKLILSEVELEISSLKSKLEAANKLIENIYSRLEHKGVDYYNDDYCTECDGVLNH